MKLQPDRIETQSVTGYGPGWIAIQGEKISHSVLISSQGLRENWSCSSFADLSSEHFAPLEKLDVELIIFGSGQKLRFVPPAWVAGLMPQSVAEKEAHLAKEALKAFPHNAVTQSLSALCDYSLVRTH